MRICIFPHFLVDKAYVSRVRHEMDAPNHVTFPSSNKLAAKGAVYDTLGLSLSMTEQNTKSIPIGDSTISPFPIEKAELQPSTPIPAAMVTNLTPTIHQPETDMAETVVCTSFFDAAVVN